MGEQRGGGVGAKSYDDEKALSSVNHSILFGLTLLADSSPDLCKHKDPKMEARRPRVRPLEKAERGTVRLSQLGPCPASFPSNFPECNYLSLYGGMDPDCAEYRVGSRLQALMNTDQDPGSISRLVLHYLHIYQISWDKLAVKEKNVNNSS
jgi:hypothetical protein